MKLIDKWHKILKDKPLINNNKFFSFEDINKLELDYDLAVVLGEKNIGKTFAFYELINKLKRGKEFFVFMRILKTQTDNAKRAFNIDDKCPFIVKGDQAFWKEYDTNGNLLPNNQLQFAGRFISYSTASNNNSSFPAGYKLLFFDEIIPQKADKKYDIDILQLILTINNIRRKGKDFKTYLIGNNLYHSTLIQDLGINPQDEVIYKKIDTFNFLFINTKNNYQGLKESPEIKILKQLNSSVYQKLINNEAISASEKVLTDPKEIKAFKDWLVFSNGDYLYRLKKLEGLSLKTGNENTVYYLERKPLFTIENKEIPLTCSSNYYNLYKSIFIPKQDFQVYIELITSIALSNKLYLNSYETLNEFIKSFENNS